MFNLILERCVSLMQEHANSKQDQNTLLQDVHVLLPAVKIWCDWLLCHSGVWNPPPSTQDYRVGLVFIFTYYCYYDTAGCFYLITSTCEKKLCTAFCI